MTIAIAPSTVEAIAGRSLWQDAFTRLKRNRAAVVSLVVLAVIALLAVFAPLLSPYPFDEVDFDRIGVPPDFADAHWFGTDANGRPHKVRLFSVASPRDGERPNTNNLALTVKRVAEPRPGGGVQRGVASNYVCDLELGETVDVIGPFGSTFLLPEDPSTDVIMICTGTGSAPFRAFTERRRRTMPSANGKLYLFFGARSPAELPYFGPLKKVPAKLLDQELVFSRLPGQAKEYVQDRMRKRAADLAALLNRDTTHVYVCGLRGMEDGVEASFRDICGEHGLDWSATRARMRETGRYHVETY